MIYTTPSHPDGPNSRPWYQRRGDLIFRVYGHPKGPSHAAIFKVIGGGRLIRIDGEKSAFEGGAWYVLRDGRYYPDVGHPQGRLRVPWFEDR